MTSTDATLSGLSVSPGSLSPEFASATTVYTATVGYDVAEVTVSHTANHASATAAVLDGSDATLSDAGGTADGFQVALGDKGADTVFKVKVTAQDTTTTETYQITVTRESGADLANFSYRRSFKPPSDDVRPEADGFCSDGTTIWTSDVSVNKLFAYNKDGSRDSSKDITLHDDNDRVGGSWCNDTTVWVSDFRDYKLYAYTLSNGSRDSSKDIALGRGGQRQYKDIWSDGTTMYLLNYNGVYSGFYAYTLSNGNRDRNKEFRLNRTNSAPWGVWSDGTTAWVSDINDGKLYAYNLSTKQHDADKTFSSLHFSNHNPLGVWFDSETMWVGDLLHQKIYVYERVGGV